MTAVLALPATPTRLITRQTGRFLLAAVGPATSFYLLLTVVPVYAAATGARAATAAGAATAALMLATVVAELAAPRLIGRFGRRWAMATSMVLLGLPALALTVSARPALVLSVCVLRGLGFGLAVVVGSAWLAELVPVRRRGEALGLYGVVIGLPAIGALPLGMWLAAHVGFSPVFVAGAIGALIGLVPLAGLPAGSGRRTGRAPVHAPGVLSGLRTPALVRPALVFSATAIAAGIVVTFLPMAASRPTAALVAPALLAQAAAATVGRWWAGRIGDRHGPARLLTSGALIAALGVALLAAIGSPVAILAGTTLFGAGFGIAQNSSISLMFIRAERRSLSHDTVSAVWNIGYDSGMGLGAAGFGLLATQAGYPIGFLVAAALIPASLVLLRGRTPRTS